MGTRRVHYTELAPAAPTSLHALEAETYRRVVGRLLAEGHAGEFVLIQGDDIIGCWPTRKEALLEAFRRFREALFTVDEVKEWHDTLTVHEANPWYDTWVVSDRGRVRRDQASAPSRLRPAVSVSSG